MTTVTDTSQTEADAHACAPGAVTVPGDAAAVTSAPAGADAAAALDSPSAATLAPGTPVIVEPAVPGLAAVDPGVDASPASLRPATPPADCGPLLKKTFPALFTGGPKPIKLRIQLDIQERAPGVFSKQALSAFFRRYTGSTSYLIAVSRAKTRFDLDGAPAGEVSEEHRNIALEELARRRGNNESRAALEEQQRRNRATLLHDFERTTLTPANFCALKGIGVDELDGYLATARREAAERPQPSRGSGDATHAPGNADSRRPAAHRQLPARPDRRPPVAAGRPPQRRR